MRLIGLVVVLSLTIAPFAAEAQQVAKIARIGYLEANLAANPYMHEAFRQGLRDLGYVEGRNLVIEYRDAAGKLERFPALAAELVALRFPSSWWAPEILFGLGSSPALRSRAATSRD